MYIPARQRTLFRARFARKRRPCFSSTSLNVSRLNVDMVVKAPSTPTVRNSLDDSGRALDLSALKVMILNVKEPRMLTPRVPMGNLADPWMAVDSINLNTAPMKPPSPTYSKAYTFFAPDAPIFGGIWYKPVYLPAPMDGIYF